MTSLFKLQNSHRLFVAGLLISSVTANADPDRLAHLTDGQPADVVSVIKRIVACNYWLEHKPSNPDRAQALASSRCDQLADDEAMLLDHYGANSSVGRAIASAREFRY